MPERKASQQSVPHDHRDKYALDAGDSAPSRAVFYASAFFRSNGVLPTAPAPVAQTVGRNTSYEKRN